MNAATKRVGVAGLLHKPNTFLVVPTTRENFVGASLTKDFDVLERWAGSKHEFRRFYEGSKHFGLAAIPILATLPIPSGTVATSSFE